MSLKADSLMDEPISDVNDEEAKEIDSCLNFLSILDEETSNDSCDFTLFRKKDEKTKDSKNKDSNADNGENEIAKFTTVEDNDAVFKNVSSSSASVVDKDKHKLKGYVNRSNDLQDVRSHDSKDNNQSISMKKFKDNDNQVKFIREGKIYQKKSTLEFTKPIVRVTGKSPVKNDTDLKLPDVLTSENIEIISPQVLKISSTYNTSIKSPVSKSEASSIIKMNDNIILKVSRSVIKQNVIPRLTSGKILHTNVPLSNSLKEKMPLIQLGHLNNSNLDTHQLPRLKDNKVKELIINTKNTPYMKDLNISVNNDNSCCKDLSDVVRKLKTIPASDVNGISTVCDNMRDKNDNSPSNATEIIKHFPVKHISNKKKVVEVNTTTSSLEVTNTAMEMNSFTNALQNPDSENRGHDSCGKSTENLINNTSEKFSNKVGDNLSEKLDNKVKECLSNKNMFKNSTDQKTVEILSKIDTYEELSVKNLFENLPNKYTQEEYNEKKLQKLSNVISDKSYKNLSDNNTSEKSLGNESFTTLSGSDTIGNLGESNTFKKSDKNISEELSDNSLDHKTFSMSDEDFVNNRLTDFVPLNPYSSVEIIKRPIKHNHNNINNNNNNNNNKNGENKQKFRIRPGLKNSKCKKTNTSLKATMHKPNLKRKSKEMYLPLKRTELPTFLQPLGLQDSSIVPEECKSSHSNEKMVVNVRSHSQLEEDQSNITAASVKTPLSLCTSESLLPVDPDHGDIPNTSNIDQLSDHNSYCQSANSNACEPSSDNILGNGGNSFHADSHAQHISNTKDYLNDLIHSTEQPPYVGEEVVVADGSSAVSCDETTTMSYVSETTLSCVSEDSNFVDKSSMESTQLNLASLQVGGAEDATAESVSENEERNDVSSESPLPVLYCFNKSSLLSFSVQNILENMFKYETFPSSTNMARLAKLMGVQWKDIRDWFVGRRGFSKKNGIYLRNQSFTCCTYCPELIVGKDDRAIAHLLTREHIQNMMNLMEKHDVIFTQIQSEINLENGVNAEETSPKSKFENVGNADSDEIRFSKKVTTKPEQKTNLKNNVPQKAPYKSPVKEIHFSAREIIHKPPTALPSEQFKVEYVSRKNIKKNIDSKVFVGYRCPVCLKIFSTEWTLIRHSISHRKLICSECKEVFVREELLQHHFLQHLLESMSEKLYSTYICLKCCRLICICDEETHCPPSLNLKYYIRPQTARRSRPFRTPPYSGVNEHLKVTMDEFWEKYRRRKPKRELLTKSVGIPPEINLKSSMKPPPPPKRPNSNSSSTPTYTSMATFNCHICESFFFTPDELKEHLTVHKIQARNRSRKREQEDLDLEANKKAKYAKGFHQSETFVCSYCFKSFKTKNILFKHVRLPCKLIPNPITMVLKSGAPLHLQKINNSNKYKVQIQLNKDPTTASKTPSPRKTKCKICCLEFEADQLECHKRVCIKKCTENTIKKQSEKKMTNSNRQNQTESSEFDRNPQRYYFLCRYCDTPIDSSKMLMFHVKETCNKVPNEVLSEIEAERLSSRGILMDKHYTKVEQKKLIKLLPIKKIQSVLDESSFLSVTRNYKRVKCKFCDKTPLKSCLRLHLMRQCKHIPEELQNLIEVYGQSLFNSETKINLSFLKTASEKGLSPATGILEDKSIRQEVLEDLEVHHDPDSTEIEGCRNANSRDVLYDCHLCEEKFKMSKDFITHMQNFHCMTISEESAGKWLTGIDSNDIDSEEENSSKIFGIDGQNVDTDELVSESATDCEDSAKEESLRSNTIPKEEIYESLSAEIIDETVLKEYISMEEVSEDRSSDKIKDTPSKSRNLDEELLDDLTNLDNFIETVQLEDLNFPTS